MRVIATIRIDGYLPFHDYELMRDTDNKLIWVWVQDCNLSYFKLVVNYDRVIVCKNCFALKFKPEDLVMEAQ